MIEEQESPDPAGEEPEQLSDSDLEELAGEELADEDPDASELDEQPDYDPDDEELKRLKGG